MSMLEKKSFDAPDHTIAPDKTRMDQIFLEGMTVGQNHYAPGWRWSQKVGPVVGSDICHVNHFGYVLSGRLRVRHEGGEELEFGPGDVYHINPGHDGWVPGDEEFVSVEFLPTT